MRSYWGKACAVGMALACIGAGLSLWPGMGEQVLTHWPLSVASAAGIGTALWLVAYVMDWEPARHALLNGAGYSLGVALLWGVHGSAQLMSVILAYLGYALLGLAGWIIERVAVRNRDYLAGDRLAGDR